MPSAMNSGIAAAAPSTRQRHVVTYVQIAARYTGSNGVEMREVDVSFSFAQNTLEEGDGKYCAVRLGFRQIDGFSWVDEDEERLKKSQLSFRDSPPSFRGVAIATNPEPRDSGFSLREPRNDGLINRT